MRPTIEIVKPKVVVALGDRAYRAVAAAYGIGLLPFGAAVEHVGGFALPGSKLLFPVYHCGARILNTHRLRIGDWAADGTGTLCLAHFRPASLSVFGVISHRRGACPRLAMRITAAVAKGVTAALKSLRTGSARLLQPGRKSGPGGHRDVVTTRPTRMVCA
jgi:hypothetical protein